MFMIFSIRFSDASNDVGKRRCTRPEDLRRFIEMIKDLLGVFCDEQISNIPWGLFGTEGKELHLP